MEMLLKESEKEVRERLIVVHLQTTLCGKGSAQAIILAMHSRFSEQQPDLRTSNQQASLSDH